jgi:hypothetical protein
MANKELRVILRSPISLNLPCYTHKFVERTGYLDSNIKEFSGCLWKNKRKLQAMMRRI